MKRLTLLLIVLIITLVGFVPTSVNAASTPHGVKDAEQYLRFAIYLGGCCNSLDEKSANDRELIVTMQEVFYYENGGTVRYFELWNGSKKNMTYGTSTSWKTSDKYIIKEKFLKLKKTEQTRFLSYVLTILENEIAYADENESTSYMDITLAKAIPEVKNGQNVYNALTKDLGVGTVTVAAVMHNVKPNFISANVAMSPFVNWLNVVLGVVGIVLMAIFFLTLLLDMTYIGIPMVRNMLSGRENGEKRGLVVGKLVSSEAVHAVEQTEGNKSGQSGGSAIWIYIRAKWLVIIIFLVLLVALISGRIMSLASSVINLVSGFID